MAESNDAVDLGRVLALCGFGFNERARTALLELLPSTLGEEVVAAWRQGDELWKTVGDGLEATPAAPWVALNEAEQADGERREAETSDGAETADIAADGPPQQTGDTDVDAFFAEADAQMDAHQVEADYESELPATLVARVLIGSSDRGAARVLGDLPLALQGQVVVRIARSTALSVRRILTAEERPALAALRSALEDGREVWGVERACGILRALDGTPPLRRALGSAAQVDEEVVGIVQSHLFDFGDLIRLRDTELQALLGACDNANLARALFDSGEPIRDRILANVSDRRAGLLEDETDLHAEATEDEIDLARREILARARVLYERGTITTYFGSIQSETDLDVPDPEEEEDEDSVSDQETPKQKKKVPTVRPERNLRRMGIAGLATGILMIALVSLVQWLTSGESRSSGPAARRAAVRGGASGRVAVGVERQQTAASSRQPSESAGGATQLSPGQILQTASGVHALLEFPSPEGASPRGISMVEVDPGSTVQGPKSTEASEAGKHPDAAASFYLRVGRVKVTVMTDLFTVHTPLGRVEATRGSVFRVRVVLDGTARIHPLTGGADVIVGDRRRRLVAGQGLTVKPDGSVGRYQPDAER
ncbi:MAG: FliG C-terminal domain-containing protein [Candidatus Latescibacterota bacterium]|nr:FliG C-terminal domain-containing protein [Candidatus Latescibacterota bacterium]